MPPILWHCRARNYNRRVQLQSTFAAPYWQHSPELLTEPGVDANGVTGPGLGAFWMVAQVQDDGSDGIWKGIVPFSVPISGVISSARVDLDGETIDQSGLDWTLVRGMDGRLRLPLTFGHPYSKEREVGFGHETAGCILDDGTPATRMSGILVLKGADGTENPWAMRVYRLHKALCEAGMPGIGFSIEGNAIARDMMNPKIIRKARIFSVAIDPGPKNSDGRVDAFGLHKGTLELDPRQSRREALLKGVSNHDLASLRMLLRSPNSSLNQVREFARSKKESA